MSTNANANSGAAAGPDSIWYTRCSIPTPLGIAAQLGWFEQEFAADGITVRSLQESDDPVQQDSHFEHTLPDSFRLGGAVPPIWARAKGQDTRVIGISWIDEYQAILALPESGIRSARDLKGRKLGLPKRVDRDDSVDVARASALRGLLVALETEGLGHGDAEWIDVPTGRKARAGDGDDDEIAGPDTEVRRGRGHSYTAVARALVRGDVDAIYVKDVRGAETAHLLGARVVTDLGFHPDRWVHVNNSTPRPLTINAATLRQHPELVGRFLQRVADVDAWARANPALALTRIARETNWTESWVRRAYGDTVHQSLGVDLSDTSVRGLTLFKDFLLQWGFIANDFSIADWIDPAPLAALSALSTPTRQAA
ncbi:ABC transporter substrate-binding protein [Pseudoduganella umbonata]|uniref:ABC transporter substrate-binding protein n=1 Tax=Pseudoduganella umbonata TaxID=864828 RepID=A0A4P8HZH6_9BURK|nr:ABC transporter substrate-binding protein [Pseudoduganella umbonata]MBB3224014.1 ABC-type nitrate/sulfonate/bicarbonate transport system substrate-binding protein [Pseudoduganella umbonata]QCP14110.1 ABC transporter substrate-binding protein [Pseudoduganella umbonata]